MASKSTLLSILLFLCCIVLEQIHCKPSSCDMRGVHPSECDKYKKTEKFFYCGGNKEKKIPMKYVNDDYCDCVGSNDDEPGTSACNHGRFWCSNIGYRPRYIYSSLVNDGLCDCCDGSDEYNNKRIKCPNVCNEKAKEELQEFVQQKKKYMEGIKVKNSLLAVAKSKLNEKLNKKQQIEKDLQQKRQELERQEEIKKIAEDKESEYREEKNKKEEEEKAKKAEEKRLKCQAEGGQNCDGSQPEQDGDNDDNEENKDNEEEEIKTDNIETEEVREQIQTEETSRERRRRERRERHEQRLERNRQRRERRKAARESARKSAEEQANIKQTETEPEQQENKEEKDEKHHEHTPDEEFPYPEQYRPHDEEQHIEHTPDEEFPYPEEYRPHHVESEGDIDEKKEEKDDGFDWSEFDDEEDEEDMYIPPATVDDDEEHEEEEEEVVEESDPLMDELSDKARDARSDYNNIDREVRDLENDIKDIDKILEMDFGEKNIYASLFDECYTKRIDKYDYEFCPFNNAKQKEGSRSTDLGTFKSFGYNDARELMMIFDEGQKCWNGPKRSAHILFQCDTENEIKHVTEPSTCKYSIIFHTPLACNQQELDRFNDLVQNQFKTEL